MLEDVDEGGIRPWHLVKPSEEPEARPRRGSLRGGERERAKAIPEIYLTRLLSMKVGQPVGWGAWALQAQCTRFWRRAGPTDSTCVPRRRAPCRSSWTTCSR